MMASRLHVSHLLFTAWLRLLLLLLLLLLCRARGVPARICVRCWRVWSS